MHTRLQRTDVGVAHEEAERPMRSVLAVLSFRGGKASRWSHKPEEVGSIPTGTI